VIALAVGASTASAQVEELIKDGDRYYERGDLDRAASAYDRAISRAPKRVPPGVYGKRAGIFIIKKKCKAGLQWVVQTAEKHQAGAWEVLEQKALLYWCLGSKPDAIKAAESVVKQKPDRFGVQRIIGEFYFLRKPKRAIKALEAYLKYRPKELENKDVLPRIRLGFAYLRIGAADPSSWGKAEAQFEILLKKHRKRRNAEVNANTGLCAAYLGLGKFDRAITLCERIITDPRKIDRRGSVWYNLGQAYLMKKQARKARTAGTEFIRMRKSEPKGYILVGDAYFQERDYSRALEQYLQAENLAKGNADLAAKLGIKLGTTYRRLNRPKQAIAKLQKAIEAQPNDAGLAAELGNAYLADKQDRKALGTVDRLIKGKEFPNYSDRDKTLLLNIAARAFYNTKKYKMARDRYEAAYKLRPRDIKIRIGLVQTINYQAYRSFKRNKMGAAEAALNQALKYDGNAAITNQNLAVIAIERGRCDDALRYLTKLRNNRGYALMYQRLRARAMMCKRSPDRAGAMQAYAAAEKEALDPQVQANLVRAEVYTEWAPLIIKSNANNRKKLNEAIEKLQAAVQFAAQHAEIRKPAQRNLAVALYRRGRAHMRARNPGSAVIDFEVAARYPNLLKGTESLVFDFALAMAHLEKGNANTATKLFRRLNKRGKENLYLKAPFNRIGTRFFAALARYRTPSLVSRRQAATEFQKMLKGSGSFAGTIRSLITSAWSFVAYEAWRTKRGRWTRVAGNALKAAQRNARTPAERRVISHNRAVLSMGSKRSNALLKTFQGMGVNPPEALANYGVMLDRSGNPRGAYDAWVKARARGVRSGRVRGWINAKKRIYNY
jgi:tetratricopeptide (TPR) repeat protein